MIILTKNDIIPATCCSFAMSEIVSRSKVLSREILSPRLRQDAMTYKDDEVESEDEVFDDLH